MKFNKSVLMAALFAATLPLTASAGLFDDEEARKAIMDLKAKVAKLEADLKNLIDTKTDKSATLDLIAQQDQAREEVARLRGQVEILLNELQVAQKRQKDYYTDLDTRLKKLEPRQVTIDGQTTSVNMDEQNAYDNAMALFKGGDFKGAANALQDFVRRYGASAYVANAQYMLGNAYYAQGDCKNAITAQQVVVKNWPDSPKAADAMLNIASCQTELKAVNNAKKTLQDLIKTYPGTAAAATAKDRLKAK